MADDIDAPHRARAAGTRSAGHAKALRCLQEQEEAEQVIPGLRGEHGVLLAESARSWFLGAVGEIEVGALLDGLGPEWSVRHSVPVGTDGDDVPHLVIGPPGVFAITTAVDLGGRMPLGDGTWAGGGRRTHQRKARAVADDLARRLATRAATPVAVWPVIALPAADDPRGTRAEQRAPYAVRIDRLTGWLTALPARLDDAELTPLRAAVDDATARLAPPPAETAGMMLRFQRLRAELVEDPSRRSPSAPERDRAAAPPRPSRALPRPPRSVPPPAGAPQRRRTGAGAVLATLAVLAVSFTTLGTRVRSSPGS